MAGSQIASICRNAAMMAITERIHRPEKKSSSRLVILSGHFKEAVRAIRTSEGNARC